MPAAMRDAREVARALGRCTVRLRVCTESSSRNAVQHDPQDGELHNLQLAQCLGEMGPTSPPTADDHQGPGHALSERRAVGGWVTGGGVTGSGGGAGWRWCLRATCLLA